LRVSDLPVLDPRPLRDLLDLGAGPDLIHELITLFMEDAPPRLTLIKDALAAGDGPKVLMEAHQLKGALGNLGLARFAALAARLEACVREGHLAEANSISDGLPQAYEDALAALRAAHQAG
jgi:HPt (histidine-containing phosphotransfer) domain-containing protein